MQAWLSKETNWISLIMEIKFDVKLVSVLHAILEDLKLISGQKCLYESCRILNVDESGHKI